MDLSVYDRLAAFFLLLAEEAQSQLEGPKRATWFNKLEIELDNLRTVLQWTQESGKAEMFLRLAEALFGFGQDMAI